MKCSLLYLCLGLSLASCEDFLDRTPIDFPTEGNFYTDVKGLEGAVIGLYDELQSGGQYGSNYIVLMEIRGDNVKDDNPGAGGGTRNEIEVFTETPANTILSGSWSSLYKNIYRSNLILQNASEVHMPDSKYNEIIGQASFVRALSYFNLVRLWGNVPLITKSQTVDEARNNKRADIKTVYDQIVSDLEVAKSLPSEWSDNQKGRVTSYAAHALLAKVYLYQKQYAKVLDELKPVVDAIHTGTELALVPTPETFPNNLKTSKDVIFAIQYLKGGLGESVHQNDRYRNNDNSNVITLNLSEFESDNDNRKALLAPTGSGERPRKFNAPATNNETSSDFPVLRCAEVMLMKAEALNEMESLPTQEAVEALNQVRLNAGLAAKKLSDFPTKDSLRDAIIKERRLELALEGDRWFDIVRTNIFNDVFAGVATYRQLYPVPLAEIENVNDKSGWQNEGYTIN